MARPVGGYKVNGKRVPGVTTVIKDNVGGLMHWAWQCGIDGIDYRQARDSAAHAGSMCHDMIEAHILGQAQPYLPESQEGYMAHTGFEAFRTWYDKSGLVITETETSLCSADMNVGGTLDAIGTDESGTYILDWKTSNAVRPEYLLQLAGYILLYEEANESAQIDGCHLLRVGKESAAFHHHYYPRAAMCAAVRAFHMRCELYQLMKQVGKVL